MMQVVHLPIWVMENFFIFYGLFLFFTFIFHFSLLLLAPESKHAVQYLCYFFGNPPIRLRTLT